MFTPSQLHLLEELLEGQWVAEQITHDELIGLKAAVQSALWNASRNLSAKDRALIAQAEKEGRVAILTHVHNAAATPGGWTLASKISDRIANEKKSTPVTTAETGDDLLAALGL